MELNSVSMSEIKIFWDWFSKNCKKFGAEFENAELLDELDNRVNGLGAFSWEIGPGKRKDYLLVISPNGDLDLLQSTKKIVDNAIACEGWEYYYAKQPKQWDLKFAFETNERKQIEIDASQWEYVLLRYEDGMFAVIIKASHIRHLDDTDKLTAAEIVLDGILGEELRMRTICEIDIVEEFDKSNQSKASDIKELANHLKKLPNK